MNDAHDPAIWFGTRVEPGEYASLDKIGRAHV